MFLTRCFSSSQLRGLHQSRLHSAGGSGDHLEGAGVGRAHRAHPHRPRHPLLVSDHRGEEARQPQAAAGAEVGPRSWKAFFFFFLRLSVEKISNWRLFIFYFFQGRSQFRNWLDGTGQHDLGDSWRPADQWADFALGNLPGTVVSRRRCPPLTLLLFLNNNNTWWTQSAKLLHFFPSVKCSLSFLAPSDLKSRTFCV